MFTEPLPRWYSLDEADLAAQLAQLTRSGDADVTLWDARAHHEPADFMQAMAQRWAFPDYFGGNLDALYDVVQELALVLADAPRPQIWLMSVAPSPALHSIAQTLQDAVQDGAPEGTTAGLHVIWCVAAAQ